MFQWDQRLKKGDIELVFCVEIPVQTIKAAILDWGFIKVFESQNVFCPFMTFETICHTVGVHSKFSSYPQKPIFVIVGLKSTSDFPKNMCQRAFDSSQSFKSDDLVVSAVLICGLVGAGRGALCN